MARKGSTSTRGRIITILLLVLFAVIVWYWENRQKGTVQTTPANLEVTYGGLPKNVAHICRDIKQLDNIGFTVGYCEDLKNPVWVVYPLGTKSTDSGKRPQRFAIDKRTKARVAHGDYSNSGYDRGHMAPNHAIATRYGREAQLQTFLMSNICPQKPKLNQKTWRVLEQKISDDYAERLEAVWIVTGPIFGKKIKRLKKSRVAIPEAFFKVVIDEKRDKVRSRAYIVPQNIKGNEKADQFLTSIDEVEQRTGLDLMWELADDIEAPLERIRTAQAW